MGIHLEVHNARIGRLRRRHACRNPSLNNLIFRRSDWESLAAAMRDGERRLEQNKTLGRLQTVRSEPNGLVGKRIVIDDGIVAAQGQFESIFPSGGAMTWTGVAAHLGHHGQNMITKTPHKRNSKV